MGSAPSPRISDISVFSMFTVNSTFSRSRPRLNYKKVLDSTQRSGCRSGDGADAN